MPEGAKSSIGAGRLMAEVVPENIETDVIVL
jgi:hypothetical protein